ISAYAIDASTGMPTELGGSPFTNLRLRAVAVEPSGRFAYALTLTGVQALAVDAASGALSTVGPVVTAGTTPISLTIDPTAKFVYVMSSGSGTISGYAINATSGELTRFNTSPDPNIDDVRDVDARFVTVGPSGRVVYAVDDVPTLPGAVTFY